MKTIKQILITLFFVTFNQNILADGTFLRNETGPEFSIQSTDADFYVSSIGNDNWSGKLADPNPAKTDGPFETIERAQQAVRELKRHVYEKKEPPIETRFIGSPHIYGKGRDIMVLIRGGIYPISQPIKFEAKDGGERVETNLPTGAFEYHKLKDYYVTYGAYPDETPIITGGRPVLNWTKKQNSVWETTLTTDAVNSLYVNGKRQTLARTPNEGYFPVAVMPTNPNYFQFHDGDLQTWPNMENNRIHLVVRWATIHSSIKSIDKNNNHAYLEMPHNGLMDVPPKYYVENIKVLLDSPGEWFFDEKTKVLSLIPPAGISNPNDAVITVPYAQGLFAVQGSKKEPVRNLRFYGLTLQETAEGGTGTIGFSYVKNCEVILNTIQNVGQTAVHLGVGSYHNLVSKNTIMHVKGNGVNATGTVRPDHFEDWVSDNQITYNSIIDCWPASVGIYTANALRTTIAHNRVSKTGSYGIAVGSWPNVEESSDGNHLVEFNHVSETCLVRDDEGGIAVYGLSEGSVVRNNVIHDVAHAETNENVGLFFQNMSSGWTVTNNIYYNLQQAEMKLCACYLTDNVYENNFTIEAPATPPESIIDGLPKFTVSNLKFTGPKRLKTGEVLKISADVKNVGSTGMFPVDLYRDGKVVESKLIPVISNNSRAIEFEHQFYDPGKHIIAIGNTPYQSVRIYGKLLYTLYSDLSVSQLEIPNGSPLNISCSIQNVRNQDRTETVHLKVDGKVWESQKITLLQKENRIVTFSAVLPAGEHTVKIGNQSPISILVWETETIDISKNDLLTYCSGTAQPCEFDFGNGPFEIAASGTDFLHAEDSYGAIYLKKAIHGNFIATVKVIGFGERVSDWFRAGIFLRNDISKSHETEPGSLGSVLMFTTPGRAGLQWDEYGDGSMHNAKSFNYPEGSTLPPVWLKIERHGDNFSGYYSFDGKNWVLSRSSGEIAGLGESMDIGLAAGTNDQRPALVQFEDFKLVVEMY
jgi:hypothetical protein